MYYISVMQLSSLLGKIIQAKFFIHHNHLKRVVVVVILNVITYSLLGGGTASKHIVGFYLAILASLLGGTAYGAGEATTYGNQYLLPLIYINIYIYIYKYFRFS